jgi:hypothetical protein
MKPKAFGLVYTKNNAKILARYVPRPEKEKIHKHDHYCLVFSRPKSKDMEIYLRKDEAIGIIVVISKLLWEYT